MCSTVPLILFGLESHYATAVPYDTVLNLTRGDIHSGRGVEAGGSGAGRDGAGQPTRGARRAVFEQDKISVKIYGAG